MAKLSFERQAAGWPVSELKLALHLCDGRYGKISARDQLNFTVVGPAVSGVSRIETMCRALEPDLIVCAAFATAAEAAPDLLVSLDRYVLRAVSRPQELFILDFLDEDEEQ